MKNIFFICLSLYIFFVLLPTFYKGWYFCLAEVRVDKTRVPRVKTTVRSKGLFHRNVRRGPSIVPLQYCCVLDHHFFSVCLLLQDWKRGVGVFVSPISCPCFIFVRPISNVYCNFTLLSELIFRFNFTNAI